MLLDIDLATNTATAHHDQCARVPKPHTPDRPFGLLGTAGGWFAIADKEHAQEKLDKYLPGARLLACRECFDAGRLRPCIPGRVQEDWER